MSYSRVISPVVPIHVTNVYRADYLGAIFNGVQAASSNSWPSANRAYYCPIYLPNSALLARFFVASNTALNASDIGIYTEAGVLITSTGSVTPTAALTYYDVTDVQLGPGWYFLGMSHSGTGAHYQIAPSVNEARIAGVLQEASAFPLPSTMTGVALTSAYLPIFGFTQSSTI